MKNNLQSNSLSSFYTFKKSGTRKNRILYCISYFQYICLLSERILFSHAHRYRDCYDNNSRTLRRFEKGFCAWHTFPFRETYLGEASAKWVSISSCVLLFSRHTTKNPEKYLFSDVYITHSLGPEWDQVDLNFVDSWNASIPTTLIDQRNPSLK